MKEEKQKVGQIKKKKIREAAKKMFFNKRLSKHNDGRCYYRDRYE
ncbi:hypothetical protein [Peptoanaerobacter stomatis]